MNPTRLCNGASKFKSTATDSKWSMERHSLGIFAGYWCDACWPKAGYRTEGQEGFDPTYAGESYEEVD